MNVSFTGINNIYIGKKKYSKFGTYLGIDNEIKHGNKLYTEIKLKCNLTNDEKGNDLDDFKKTLSRCRPCYQYNCIDKNNPNKFELHLKRFDTKDDVFALSNSNFDINNYEIMLDEKQILPLLDYIAKVTKKLSQSKNLTDNQKQVMSFVNKSIAKEAEEFIENYY